MCLYVVPFIIYMIFCRIDSDWDVCWMHASWEVYLESFFWRACLPTCPGSTTHDLSSNAGLLTAVVAVLCISIGGLIHLATVCTSFVFINSGTHGRSSFCPEGLHADREYVQLGTTLASRSSLLALLAWAMGAVWILEQPSSSCMLMLQSWQFVLKFFAEKLAEGWSHSQVLRNAISMAAFRGPTLKPTALWSNESLDLLMNMPVLPKDARPKSEAPVVHVWLDKKKIPNWYAHPGT